MVNAPKSGWAIDVLHVERGKTEFTGSGGLDVYGDWFMPVWHVAYALLISPHRAGPFSSVYPHGTASVVSGIMHAASKVVVKQLKRIRLLNENQYKK